MDAKFGFDERKVVDFRSVLSVPRIDLENLRPHRLGRLNDVADEHFRESLAQFFRRYPVNGWYPLTSEEFDAYAAGIRDPNEKPAPYPWQDPGTAS